MTESPISKGIREKSLQIVYEDEDTVLFLDERPASPGHMVLSPKSPFTIMEEVPDWLIGRMGEIANKASSAAFETLGAKGTNILIQNGIPAGQDHNHFSIHIIPRFEGDNINFGWKAKQLSEEEMSTVELLLKEKVEGVGNFEKGKPMPKIEEPQIDEPPEPPPDEGENMMLKQLDRIP